MELRRLVLVLCLVTIISTVLPLGSAYAISQAEVLQRAHTWTDKKVPYSQKKRYQGYRMDCSGFVSYALGLGKPGATTRTLGWSTVSVKKRDLVPGDILLSKNKHVVLFGGWADKKQTKYYGLEESGKHGAIKRVIPYPYFNHRGKYVARRYVRMAFSKPVIKPSITAAALSSTAIPATKSAATLSLSAETGYSAAEIPTAATTDTATAVTTIKAK